MTRRAAIILIAFPLAGCLEPPVSESLEIRMLRGGASVVSIGVVLRDPSEYDKAPRVQQRLESEARDLGQGSDPWSARLHRVEPERQKDVIDRERGGLRRVVRNALLATPDDLREFFRDTGIGVTYVDGAGAEQTATADAYVSRRAAPLAPRRPSASVSTSSSRRSAPTWRATSPRRSSCTTISRGSPIARGFAWATFSR